MLTAILLALNQLASFFNSVFRCRMSKGKLAPAAVQEVSISKHRSLKVSLTLRVGGHLLNTKKDWSKKSTFQNRNVQIFKVRKVTIDVNTLSSVGKITLKMKNNFLYKKEQKISKAKTT